MKTAFQILLVQLLFFAQCSIAEIYKYQDANGKWQYTDKKPQKAQAEVVSYKTSEAKQIEPELALERRDNVYYLRVKSPFYAPIELELVSTQFKSGRQKWLIPALANKVLIQSKTPIEPFQYRWHLGDPAAIPAKQLYQFPVDSDSCVRISQGFNGRFSHSTDHSRFAVDVALNVGTPILAARAGVVVGVKDDYHMGGVNEYFLDKANYISVMHEDGSFAGYFHILLGSAEVKPGDQVHIGQKLAESGSSGFSSGPHLHFVITLNRGFSNHSIPFKFVAVDGAEFTPQQGMKICDQSIGP